MKVTGLQNIDIQLDKATDPARIRAAILDTYAMTRKRIFEEGKAADGTKIGSYSTEPIYVNPKDSPRKFPPKGKTGKTKFKSGKAHKTRYFGDGYKGFRAKAGRQSGTVDLRLTGGLRNAFLPEFPKGENPVLGFVSEGFDEIADGNEKRFGKKIFKHTTEELNHLTKLIQDAF